MTLLSIVLPVFNEAASISGVLKELHETVCRRLKEAEVLLIDDCSTDATARVLTELGQVYPYMRAIRHARNLGHGPAIRRGFLEAKGEYVLQMDSDGQVDPAAFWKAWDERRYYQAILGYRQKRHDPLYRRSASALIRWMIRRLFGVRLRDANCPFKLFRREFLENALNQVDQNAFAPSLLLAVFTAYKKSGFLEIPVMHRPRPFGKSSLPGTRFLFACLRSFRELLAHRCRWKRLG